MRIILGLLILLSACKSGPRKQSVSFKDLEPLQGNWSGTQSVLLSDDQTVTNFPTQVDIYLLKDSLQLDVITNYTDGHQERETGILSIHKNDSILSFGASEYIIQDVIKTKGELTVIAYKEDEDNDKPAGIRLTIRKRAKELIMLREVKYTGTEKYFTRINLELKRNK
jgi:hypothetical protein